MKQVYENFIYLIRQVLDGKSADDFACEDFGQLLGIARSHNMSNMLYYALRNNANVPKDMAAELGKNHNLIVYKYANQRMAEQELEQLFNENGIRHMVIKGQNIRSLYPSEDMREMSDIDLFADKADFDKIREVMTGAGYISEGYRDHHDVYSKEPLICIEVHDDIPGCLEKHFYDSWEKAEKKEFKHSLNPSDNYLSVISHAHGHFAYGGIGIRAFLDIFLLENKMFSEIDWEYVNTVLKKYDLLDFANNVRAVNNYWFGEGESNSIVDEMSEYVYGSGSYGNVNNVVMYLAEESDSNFQANIKILKKVIFLPASEMRSRMKIIDKFPFLLPFGYLARLVSILFKQFGRLTRWVKGIRKVNVDSVKQHKEKLERFGIR